MTLARRFAAVLSAPLMVVFSLNAVAADRIVSVGGDVTEIVYALGAGDRLVARDTTSTLPAAKNLPDVGYMRQLNAEGILSLKPTMVLASELAEPSLVLRQIADVGVKVVPVSGEASLDNVPHKIQQVASALNLEKQGAAVTQKYEQQLAAVPRTPLKTKVLFILSHGGMTPMAAGQDTAADAIIKASGAQNAMQGFSRYRPLSQEGVVASAPDLVLITSDGFKTLGTVDKVWALPGMALTPAAKNKQILVVDDMALLGFSLETPAALAALREAAERAQR
ncbi:hemin ABC transporter substrate-binding protein [Hafnia alvei FB1]|jgi:iron complex transport system substrate-binding protein|uniref:Hemin ABC transporter substrate-binding protein n=1 Tax=Hafnia alvei FB1 TaxID=1453496 RepID=A0A097R253_HAFAL|nr:hemin ABC transporter substrate-binding protein [Hafnia alvei]AIU72798.1 hemin ABC transporter substrate-binding protein [Hafnia alvei FB1]KID05026.1 hemin ABC transporter substrate-binding protein [Hafnia alvei]KID05531.1 hemin ABC transporter substrate-binding protein [Hafnia alvei]MBW3477897.1 hemin ABC transporter substrate-binding protein [Hafnia alvei]QBJ33262.1 hemin ABC transporter substrate-binding protein [Hafnia alvei]